MAPVPLGNARVEHVAKRATVPDVTRRSWRPSVSGNARVAHAAKRAIVPNGTRRSFPPFRWPIPPCDGNGLFGRAGYALYFTRDRARRRREPRVLFVRASGANTALSGGTQRRARWVPARHMVWEGILEYGLEVYHQNFA